MALYSLAFLVRRKPAALLFSGLVLLAGIATASAEPRHAAMIIDANTGAVLHDSGGDELRHPASLTKMMTLYMTFELIEMGRLSYSSKIKVTQEAAAAAPSKLELEPGEEITVIDAIKALVTKSANDMAIALAQHIGGTEANFARLMTEKARQLGMSKTVFRNASGLPDPQQVTTARDMITLGLHLQDDFPKHYPLFGLASFTYSGRTYRNHNTLLLSYRGTDGIKTGYTQASGFNLVASVHRDGRHLVGAIFGGESAGSRNAQLRSLFERSFPRASLVKTRRSAPQLIASARQAPRPKAAPSAPAVAKAEAPAAQARPAPAKVASAPKPQPKPVAPTTIAEVVAAVQQTPAAEPAVAMVEQAPAPSGIESEKLDTAVPTVAIAKVRRVMVATRAARAEQPPSPSQVGERSTDMPPPAPQFAMAGAGAGPMPGGHVEKAPPATATAAPAPAPPAPSTLPPQLVAEATPSPAPAGLEGSAARPPSSFEAQMAAVAMKLNLPVATPARTEEPQQVAAATEPFDAPRAPAVATPPAPTYRLKGPETEAAPEPIPAAATQTAPAAPQIAPAPQPLRQTSPVAPQRAIAPAPSPAALPSAVKKGGFQVQIGAFGTPVEANNRIDVVRQTAGALLAGHEGVTLPVSKGDRMLYRARFAGFDSTGAANACLELRSRQIDCFVMKAE